MSASLRVEVTTGGGASVASAGKTFAQEKAEREAAAAKFREDAKRFREETGMGGVSSVADERERRRRIAAENKQERDEAFAERQEIRAKREEEKRERERERQQKRDEDYADRQEAMERRRAAQQQKRDEDYAERQEREERKRQQASDPVFLATKMREQAALREATRQEYIRQMGGNAIDPNGMLNRTANLIQNATGMMSRFLGRGGGQYAPPGQLNRAFGGLNSSILSSARTFGIVGAVVGAFGAALKHARETLLNEARRVAAFSGALRAQEVRNTLRDMRTDRQIASEYGEQLAAVSDRENRQQNAWRLIGTQVSSVVDKLVAPLSEMYTQMLEYAAGTHETQADLSKHMGLITRSLNLTIQEIKQLGVSNRELRDYADAVKVAEEVIKSMGSSGFNSDDPLKEFEQSTLFGLKPGSKNPGIIPDILPKDWKGRVQWQAI